MGRNITFNLDDKLVKAARLYALENDTTLTDIVKEHLQALTWTDEKKADWNKRFLALRKSSGLSFPEGFISKDELYDKTPRPDGHEHSTVRRHG